MLISSLLNSFCSPDFPVQDYQIFNFFYNKISKTMIFSVFKFLVFLKYIGEKKILNQKISRLSKQAALNNYHSPREEYMP